MVVLKQLGAGPELVHCHVTLTVEVLVDLAVTSVGVGGAEGGRKYLIYIIMCDRFHCMLSLPLTGRKTILGTLILPV